MKDKYERIQNYIFSLIPEKWEEIYLYASVENEDLKEKSGELFFYYIPKGILKMRPINVYEVPQRFNINEEQYLRIVEDLYNCIKSLEDDFIDTEQETWTNLTISIANFKFKVEYMYNDLPKTYEEVFERNVIWKYKYLKIRGENKKERVILDDYYTNMKPFKKETYETGLYLRTENNKITFGKEDSNGVEFFMYEKDEVSNIINKTKKKLRYSSNKNKDDGEQKENEQDENEPHSKNQILNN